MREGVNRRQSQKGQKAKDEDGKRGPHHLMIDESRALSYPDSFTFLLLTSAEGGLPFYFCLL